MSRTDKYAFLFLMPFLFVYVYGVFLIYPMLKGFWVSLHDWHLLKVALNPDAKEFVGLKNYRRVVWGKGMEWSALQHPVRQIPMVVLAGLFGWLGRRYPNNRALLWLLASAALTAAFAIGWAPGEDGRWYNRKFWPVVGNTLFLVAWIVPLTTAISLVLAVVLNRPTRGPPSCATSSSFPPFCR